ncbi:MAG: FtsX-like permease family protein [Treponema sp.]|nr:FtsX-like permease family protein [Treponema sp.]MBQ1670736.1 FtsX-like permease family protein [Treponema sp.]MBQ2206529.1 FtsX-like permease family protein [Treponema sp.]MBQ2480560.1 FtsX-like permease family protein [Treponema sp.]MBR0126283.1 FtsX-like permease family protein [Treponema sp.]
MTRQKFYFKMITSSLIRRRSRMLVALLAVAIGATVLSGLVTIYYDVPRQMGKEFRSYGANLMLVSAGAEDIGKEALNAAEAQIPAKSLVGLTAFRYETMSLNRLPFMVGGIDFLAVQKTRPYWGISGQYPKEKGEALLGQTVAQTVAAKVGDRISLSGSDSEGEEFTARFTVSGILQTGGGEEDCIFIDQKEMDLLMKNSGLYDFAECSISANAVELEAIAKKISDAEASISPRLVKRVTKSEGSVLKKLQSLVWIVTLVVLILTMVCVATTMMAVVAERRKEIGLKKALGASNKNIVKEFLGEGLFLGALGGVIGVALGFWFAQKVSMNVFSRSISFQPLLAPVTVLVSVITTGIACMIPVRNAATVDPVIVLRGE